MAGLSPGLANPGAVAGHDTRPEPDHQLQNVLFYLPSSHTSSTSNGTAAAAPQQFYCQQQQQQAVSSMFQHDNSQQSANAANQMQLSYTNQAAAASGDK